MWLRQIQDLSSGLLGPRSVPLGNAIWWEYLFLGSQMLLILFSCNYCVASRLLPLAQAAGRKGKGQAFAIIQFTLFLYALLVTPALCHTSHSTDPTHAHPDPPLVFKPWHDLNADVSLHIQCSLCIKCTKAECLLRVNKEVLLGNPFLRTLFIS